jgi:hypothetical protein
MSAISKFGMGANMFNAASNAVSTGMTAAGAVSGTTGNLQSLGAGDTGAVSDGANTTVADSAAMTAAGMQASSAVAKMNFMNSMNDLMNKVMKNAGDSIKNAI